MHNPTISEYWFEARENFRKRKERGKPEFPTGIEFIDEATDGLHRGEVWIVAGKSGGGKTSLALQLSRAFAEEPEHSIMFLSLEMKGWELTARMFCQMNGTDYNALRKGEIPLDDQQDEAFREYIQKIDIEIFEKGFRFNEVREIIKDTYHKKKPDVIFLDFLQLIDWRSFKDQRLAFSEYIRQTKELAKQLDIGIVVVSQLRRLPSGTNYDRPPDMIDLKGSGALEQTADKILLIHCEQKEGKEGQKVEEDRYFINLAKNRQGPTEKREVTFEGSRYRFKEKEKSPEVEKYKKEFGGKVL